MKVFFDESMTIYLTRSLRALEEFDNRLEIISTIEVEVLGSGALDEQIVDYLKDQDCTFITKDKDFRSQKVKMELYAEYEVRLVFIRPPDGQKHWDFVKFFFTHWFSIRDKIIKAEKRGDLSLLVNSRGITIC